MDNEYEDYAASKERRDRYRGMILTQIATIVEGVGGLRGEFNRNSKAFDDFIYALSVQAPFIIAGGKGDGLQINQMMNRMILEESIMNERVISVQKEMKLAEKYPEAEINTEPEDKPVPMKIVKDDSDTTGENLN